MFTFLFRIINKSILQDIKQANKWCPGAGLGWVVSPVASGKYSQPSILAGSFLQHLLGFQTQLHGVLCVQVQISPSMAYDGDWTLFSNNTVVVSYPDLGLQKKYPCPIQSKAAPGEGQQQKRYLQLPICSLGIFPSCYSNPWVHHPLWDVALHR